jgi:hypothetical protein
MKTTIIGLTGKAGAGKDTAAQFIREQLQASGRRVAVEAFANPIRQMLLAIGVPDQYLRDRTLKEEPIPGFNGASYRMLAQTLGTEWGRHCLGRNFWISMLQHRLARAAEVQPPPEFLVLTDVRMLNEAQWVQGQGGLLVRVERSGLEPVRDHESERIDLPCDRVLVNDAALPELRNRCADLVNLALAMRSLSDQPSQHQAA